MSSSNSNNNGSGSNISQIYAGNRSNSNFGQKVFNSPQLQQLYQAAQNMFNNQQSATGQAQQQAGKYINQVNNSALPAWQKQLGGGAYANVNGQQIQNQLAQSLNTPSNASKIYAQEMGGQGNNYADAMKDSYMRDANLAQGQMLSNLDARASGAGMMGSSRQGVAQGLGMQGINKNLQDELAQTGFSTFDKDLQNKLGIAQQADQNTLARQGMLQDMLQNKQAAMQGSVQGSSGMQNLGMGSFAPASAPWQQIQQWANALGGPAVLNSGSSNGAGWAGGGSQGTWNSSANGKSGGIG